MLERSRVLLLSVLVLILFSNLGVSAQEEAANVPYTCMSIDPDGVFLEDEWIGALLVDIIWEVNNFPPDTETELYVLHDSEWLYVCFITDNEEWSEWDEFWMVIDYNHNDVFYDEGDRIVIVTVAEGAWGGVYIGYLLFQEDERVIVQGDAKLVEEEGVVVYEFKVSLSSIVASDVETKGGYTHSISEKESTMRKKQLDIEEPKKPTCSIEGPSTATVGEDITLTLTAKAQTPGTFITSMKLDINGDGEVDYAPALEPGTKEHTEPGTAKYTEPGTYEATLTVTDNLGQTSTCTLRIEVKKAEEEEEEVGFPWWLIFLIALLGFFGVFFVKGKKRPPKPPKIPPPPKPPVITPVPPAKPPKPPPGREKECPPWKIRKEEKICRDALNKLLSNLTVDIVPGHKLYLMESVPRLLKPQRNKMFNLIKLKIEWDTTATILATNLKAEKEILGDIRGFQKLASFAMTGKDFTKTALKEGTEKMIEEAGKKLGKEVIKAIDEDILLLVDLKSLKSKLTDFVTEKIGYGIAKMIVGHDPKEVAIKHRKKLEKLYEKLWHKGHHAALEISSMEEDIKKIRYAVSEFNKDIAGLRCVKCGTYRIPKLKDWIKQLEDLKRIYKKLTKDIKTRLKHARKIFKQKDAYELFEKRFHPKSRRRVDEYFDWKKWRSIED